MWKSIGRKKDFIRKFLCFSASPLSPHTLKWKVLALFSFSCQKKAVCVCVWARESHKDRKHPVVCCEITGIDVRNKKKRKKYNKKKKSLNCIGALLLWLWADGHGDGVHKSRLNTTWMPSSGDSCQPFNRIPQLKIPLSHRRRLKPSS